MTLRVTQFDNGAAFLERVGPFLLEREALHNLVYSISAGAGDSIQPYLAAVERDERVVLAAVRIPPHNLLLSRAAVPEALEAAARDLLTVGHTPPGVHGPKEETSAFVDLWTGLSGCRSRARMAQRVHQLTELTAPEGIEGRARRATGDDIDLLTAWATAFVEEALPGEPFDARVWTASRIGNPERGVFLWERSGQPVAMTSYTQATPRGVRVSGVYTPAHLRGQGYASACVTAANAQLLAGGVHSTFVFSDLAHPNAHRMYQRIGYRPMGNLNVHTFSYGRYQEGG